MLISLWPQTTVVIKKNYNFKHIAYRILPNVTLYDLNLAQIQDKKQEKYDKKRVFALKIVVIYVMIEYQNIYCDRREDGCFEHKRHV